jgi:hypothetical protein
LIVIMVFLFATNPSEPQFKEFLKQDYKEKARSEGVGIIGAPIGSLVGLTTTRNDYLFFSLYQTSVLGEKQHYLGIVNHFVRTSHKTR